ncbi:nose resistant to fluoxetine protein 6 [Drosophila willistoni]|uniref:nose resistant to fluoxetine protein 6 n=1 Tax=Drosophila willistoni TaxID=7260 RepID=UPI000C26C959|nr:nose resistant to fluoxetine protein 6 [Drosophila willistoni]
MPELYHFDDYDLCLDKSSHVDHSLLAHRTYCMVYAEIAVNGSSQLWQEIERISQDGKHYFRHDRLFMGVCLQHCKETLRTLSKFHIQQLYEGKIEDKELSLYYDKVHKRNSDEHLHYDHLINSCLNREFGKKFPLRLRSHIEYCVKADEHKKFDGADLTMFLLLATLLILTIISSNYDFQLKTESGRQGNEFYKQNLKSNTQRLFAAFSICRNYYRLIMPHSSDISRDLRFFDAFRVIGVFVVILGHTLMLFMSIQVENPEFYEQFLYRFEAAIFQNGNVIIQIFFVMSGFLLYMNFTERQWLDTSSGICKCIGIYLRVFFNRYFRIIPSLLFLILFNATILTHLGNGPFWRHVTEAERVFCRENWWKNVLFVNNHMMEESCAQQTWYLAADMQLFELFLIVIVISKKHPRLRRYIYMILLILTFIVPALLTYYMKLDAIYHLKPETFRYLWFRHSDTFYQTYPPFYTNLGGYLFGFLSAQFYLKVRESGKCQKYRGQLKYELGVWVMLPLALLILLSGYIFIKYDFEKPSIWLAIYAGIYKNLWILICAGFVCCMCLKLGWIAYEFCTLPVFRPLARISFQAFLWHIVILRIVAGYYRKPIYVNEFSLFCHTLIVFVLTQLVAFLMTLFVEYPISELIKYIMNQELAIKSPRNKQIEPKDQVDLNILPLVVIK